MNDFDVIKRLRSNPAISRATFVKNADGISPTHCVFIRRDNVPLDKFAPQGRLRRAVLSLVTSSFKASGFKESARSAANDEMVTIDGIRTAQIAMTDAACNETFLIKAFVMEDI